MDWSAVCVWNLLRAPAVKLTRVTPAWLSSLERSGLEWTTPSKRGGLARLTGVEPWTTFTSDLLARSRGTQRREARGPTASAAAEEAGERVVGGLGRLFGEEVAGIHAADAQIGEERELVDEGIARRDAVDGAAGPGIGPLRER